LAPFLLPCTDFSSFGRQKKQMRTYGVVNHALGEVRRKFLFQEKCVDQKTFDFVEKIARGM
jgi:hypothetical protein